MPQAKNLTLEHELVHYSILTTICESWEKIQKLAKFPSVIFDEKLRQKFFKFWEHFEASRLEKKSRLLSLVSEKSINFKLLENFHKELNDVLNGPTRWYLVIMTNKVYGIKTSRKRSFRKNIEMI